MEDIKKAFDDLFYKIAVTGGFELNFIEDLNIFCNYFKDHKDYAEYRIKARSAMSMIYYEHELFGKSFDLDFEFLLENQTERADYSMIICRIAKTSSSLMRTDEVKKYVNKFILHRSEIQFLPKLALLDWYTFHYPQEMEHNNNFEDVVLEIIQALGAPVYGELPLAERIKIVESLHKDSTYNIRKFHPAYRQAAPELRVAVLEEYLSKTPLKYYQNIMKRDAEKMNT